MGRQDSEQRQRIRHVHETPTEEPQMSQTRIICGRCGFVQIHCTCKPTPDHQLARATAEKIRALLPTGYHTTRAGNDKLSEIILASYHERDRAATAMGGETPRVEAEIARVGWHGLDAGKWVTSAFARTLERELNGAYEEWKKCEKSEDDLQRALTALQESNRDVVAQLANRDVHDAYVVAEVKQLRDRLALADDLAKALEDLKDDAETRDNEMLNHSIPRANDILSRWTAPQAGTTRSVVAELCSTPEGRDKLRSAPCEYRPDFVQAVPITPETVVRKPANWPLWMRDPNEHDFPEDSERDSDNGCYSHVCNYCGAGFTGNKRRPPCCKKCFTAPTCRPTATEGGKV